MTLAREMCRSRANRAAAVLSHEVGHATYKMPPDMSSREAYVNHYLADEGGATMSNIRFSREVFEHSEGQTVVPVLGQSQNAPKYNAIYDQYLADGNAASANRAIGEIYRNGEVTSTNGQSYGDYYGGIYDNWKSRTPR